MHGWENLRDEDRDLILRGIEAGKALGGPFHAEIDPVDACNADCFFCNSAEVRQGAIFGWERLEPCIDEMIAGGLRSFRLAGGGEPLLYKKLGPLCDKMAAANVVLDMVTTNGIKLDNALEHITKLRMTNIMVSLNYATFESYKQFMRIPGERFTQVVANIRKLDAKLRELGKRHETRINTQFFMHRSTLKDLDAVVELGLSLPVDCFTIRSCGLIPQEEVLTKEDLGWLLTKFPEVSAKAREAGAWIEFDFRYEGIQPQCDDILRKHHRVALNGSDVIAAVSEIKPGTIEYCFIGWYSMLIQGTGDVHPCCFLLTNPAVKPFGNLNQLSVHDVWHGDIYRKHRSEMRTAMLFEKRTPGQMRRFTCTQEFCWSHTDCVLSHQMADWDFYTQAHARLERLRKKPLMALGRVANSISRDAINLVRR